MTRTQPSLQRGHKVSATLDRVFSFPPHPPATPAPCTAETHHNPASSQHPPGATGEHLNAQTLSPINSKQYLQLRLSPHPLVPSRGSVLPQRTAREITEWRGPPAARRSLGRPARRGSPIPPPLAAAITASLLTTHVQRPGLPSPHRLAHTGSPAPSGTHPAVPGDAQADCSARGHLITGRAPRARGSGGHSPAPRARS